MQESKIRLSPAEEELFCNAEIILTKNSVLQKTTQLLAEIQDIMVLNAPATIQECSPSPKISRGENYLGLPYLILDYPRIAKGNDLLFIRSMFWWGNFYSSTLQLGGSFKEASVLKISAAYDWLKKSSYAIGINQDPWVHHAEETNYLQIDNLSAKAFSAVLAEVPHIKIAAHWPLREWDAAAENLTKSWKVLTGLIA